MYVSLELPFRGKVYRRPCIPKSGQNLFLKRFDFKHCWKAALFNSLCPDESELVLFTCCLLLFTCQVVQ